jgi:hypothetical protein
MSKVEMKLTIHLFFCILHKDGWMVDHRSDVRQLCILFLDLKAFYHSQFCRRFVFCIRNIRD